MTSRRPPTTPRVAGGPPVPSRTATTVCAPSVRSLLAHGWDYRHRPEVPYPNPNPANTLSGCPPVYIATKHKATITSSPSAVTADSPISKTFTPNPPSNTFSKRPAQNTASRYTATYSCPSTFTCSSANGRHPPRNGHQRPEVQNLKTTQSRPQAVLATRYYDFSHANELAPNDLHDSSQKQHATLRTIRPRSAILDTLAVTHAPRDPAKPRKFFIQRILAASSLFTIFYKPYPPVSRTKQRFCPQDHPDQGGGGDHPTRAGRVAHISINDNRGCPTPRF